MARLLLIVMFIFLPAGPALAQDMPLSQILLAGEDWKTVKAAEKPSPPPPLVLDAVSDARLRQPTCTVRTGHTLYAGYPQSRALIAFTVGADNVPRHPAPYCPLRRKPGSAGVDVTALTLDRDGRIYAATSVGVQVFDPTGRLCGVLTTPPGRVDQMAFENDQLTLWIGDRKYTRRLNTGSPQ
jgi:hypothetical protein